MASSLSNTCIHYFKKNVVTAELLERVKSDMQHFEVGKEGGYYLGHFHFDEFDEVAVPWQPGYIFDENTPGDWVKLLSKLAASKEYVVFGHTSDVYGKFSTYPDWQQLLSIIWKVDCYHYDGSMYCKDKKLEATFRHGFYPSYAGLLGPLPRCMIWKVFKLR